MPVRDRHPVEEETSTGVTPQESPAALEDRISDLPDPILHQILSCPPLATRDLVLLSMLSRRWRNLWKSSPFLDFDDLCFLDGDEGDNESFARFVDMVLLLRDTSDLYSFHLSWVMDLHPHGQHHLYEWVQHAIRRNVRVIVLSFPIYKKEVDLPRSMFNCMSLEELSVMFHNTFKLQIPKIALPRTVWLPGLWKLHLEHMEIDGESMKKLILGCLGLEVLILEGCWLLSVLIIFDRLKELILDRCCIGGDSFCISCGGLESFRFDQNFIDVNQVYLHDLSSVVSATVLTDHENHCNRKLEYNGSYCGNTVDFISGLANAKTLKIISSRVEVIPEKVLSELPPFPNLKNLTLGGWKMSDKFQIVTHFLKQSPNLEMITLTSGESSQESEEEANQKMERLWFHCPNTVIACRIQCGEENEKLVDLVSKVILSTYTLPDCKIRVVPRGRLQDPGSC